MHYKNTWPGMTQRCSVSRWKICFGHFQHPQVQSYAVSKKPPDVFLDLNLPSFWIHDDVTWLGGVLQRQDDGAHSSRQGAGQDGARAGVHHVQILADPIHIQTLRLRQTCSKKRSFLRCARVKRLRRPPPPSSASPQI